ncbi:MAG: pyruvate, phosphate dikinase [Acidimicrobiales bacterium]|jgi:pyruvate,orthophosphate dikinase|nr:pyruvate, phosphate dikinase [Acidimicrobiales bacterium]
MTFVYAFDHEHPKPPMELKDLLGGKGANLAEMTSVLKLPVPPGFTISTDACRAYLADGGWPAGLRDEVDAQVARLEEGMGKRLGDPVDPLLVSVRSGAKFSMPGMMDTVLNLGLNDDSVRGLAAQTNDPRFANDSYRRFIQMYGKIVLDIPAEAFDAVFEEKRKASGADTDADIPAAVLAEVIEAYKAIILRETGKAFPQDPAEQLRGSIEAVFNSWNSPRARAYRRRERIPDDLGTAVNVQTMVFGNRDDRSGTGVGFTRNPATGEAVPYGDFLINAQGEDVVAGIRNTLPLSEMANSFPDIYKELLAIFGRLELHYRDMLDTEFTIDQDKLWMLQTRVGKRTGGAALRLAVAMVNDPTIGLSHEEAVQRVSPEHLDQVLHPQFEKTDAKVLGTGLAASPGAGVGAAYFDADRAADAADAGEKVILVRQETSPEDVHGMAVAEAILTSRGGLVSHAAVVARGWGKPAVCGAESLEIGADSFTTADGTLVREGDMISVDGSTGKVYLGEVPLAEGSVPDEFSTVLEWADTIRAGKLAVRANADTGEDAKRAREFGAEGIGLCRTEHMFLGDRLPVVRRMILADTPEEEEAALAELLEVQRLDFEEVLEAMDGLPVTVRLLDPPLHEFLPSIEELIVLDAKGDLDVPGRALLRAAQRWQEQNPMLGVRGVRLGIIKNGLYKMQVRALLQAAKARKAKGGTPIIEIMIPLIVTYPELDLVRRWVEEEIAAAGVQDEHILIGTMIETPRAAVRGDEIAEAADFFSFGTNDLTQMTFGFSRDDVATILEKYIEEGLLKVDPFETIDQAGVGELVRLGAEGGRSTKPGLKLGVCGEHGGDPTSIGFFYGLGINYVSCSPYRVPIARLSAALAALDAGGPDRTA